MDFLNFLFRLTLVLFVFWSLFLLFIVGISLLVLWWDSKEWKK